MLGDHRLAGAIGPPEAQPALPGVGEANSTDDPSGPIRPRITVASTGETALTVVPVDDRPGHRVRYRGPWRRVEHPRAWRQGFSRSSGRGAGLSFRFRGDRVYLVAYGYVAGRVGLGVEERVAISDQVLHSRLDGVFARVYAANPPWRYPYVEEVAQQRRSEHREAVHPACVRALGSSSLQDEGR